VRIRSERLTRRTADHGDSSPSREERTLKGARSLETERLVLRPFESADFDALFAIYSREDVHRYLYQYARTETEVRELLATKIANRGIERPGDRLSLAVTPKASGEIVGDVVLHWLDNPHRQGEVGYIMHPDHQGRGYTTEAVRILLAIAFEDVGLHRVAGRLEPRNTPSARVLEKLGMRREAHLVENEYVKDEWQSELIYAMLNREWRADRIDPQASAAAPSGRTDHR
jgi:RimJ/RimL family protein N-acetyltransferase